MMVLGCFCFSGGLGVYALRQKKTKAAVLFMAAFLFMMAMGYLSSRDFTKASMNWIAECVNLAVLHQERYSKNEKNCTL